MADKNENLQRVRRIGTRAAAYGSMHRPARAAQRAPEQASAEAMVVGAEKVARIAQQRLKKRKGREAEKQRKPQQSQKKLTGPLFIAMLFLTLLKDMLDIVFTFSVILIIFSVIFGLMITFTLLIYYMMNDVKLTSRKLVVFVVSMVLEILPFTGILPMASVSLVLVRVLENNERFRKMASKKAGFNAFVQGI